MSVQDKILGKLSRLFWSIWDLPLFILDPLNHFPTSPLTIQTFWASYMLQTSSPFYPFTTFPLINFASTVLCVHDQPMGLRPLSTCPNGMCIHLVHTPWSPTHVTHHAFLHGYVMLHFHLTYYPMHRTLYPAHRTFRTSHSSQLTGCYACHSHLKGPQHNICTHWVTSMAFPVTSVYISARLHM